jgi:hypothetical protein
MKGSVMLVAYPAKNGKGMPQFTCSLNMKKAMID